jgi:hypothetical protein
MRKILLASGLVLAGCATEAPKKEEAPPPAMARPAVSRPAPAPAAPKPQPVSVDLSKVKFLAENTDLVGYDEGEGKLFFYTNGAAEAVVRVAADGEYEIVITASCDAAENENAKFRVSVDGAPAGGEIALASTEAREYKVPARLKAGDRKIAVEFTNDAYRENEFDRNLYVHAIAVRPK